VKRTPDTVYPLEQIEAENRILDAIRLARSTATEPQSPKMHDLAGDVLSRRKLKPVRHLLALLHDAFQRGADEAALMEVPEELSRALRRWKARESAPCLDLNIESLHEEQAEAGAEIAEAEARISPSGQAVQKLRLAHRRHNVARERFINAVESKAYPGNVA
jgi:hypothetical protein